MVQNNTTRNLAYQWAQTIENTREKTPTNEYEWMRHNEESNRLAGVTTKVDLGKRLSHTEKEYLRWKDPDQYDRAVKLEREQRKYKKSMKRCTTKKQRRDLSFFKRMSIITGASMKARAAIGADTNDTLARLNHVREAEREGRFQRWA